MFSAEEQQIEICLLKSNLEEIENDLMVQRSALPALDAENELKYRETMAALKVVRSLNSEIERLKQENVRLTAKRTQLKRQCEDITVELERAHRSRAELEDLLTQEERETELEIRSYEDLLRDVADRFRKTRVSFNEKDMIDEIESIKKVNIELQNEEKNRHNELIELRQEFDLMQPSIPQDLLSIVGKTELEEKLKALSVECDDLRDKRDNLRNCSSNISITKEN